MDFTAEIVARAMDGGLKGNTACASPTSGGRPAYGQREALDSGHLSTLWSTIGAAMVWDLAWDTYPAAELSDHMPEGE